MTDKVKGCPDGLTVFLHDEKDGAGNFKGESNYGEGLAELGPGDPRRNLLRPAAHMDDVVPSPDRLAELQYAHALCALYAHWSRDYIAQSMDLSLPNEDDDWDPLSIAEEDYDLD